MSEVQGHLDRAAQIASGEEDWRRDVILVKVAATRELIGQSQQASALEVGVVDSEAGKVAVVRASRAGDADFDQQFGAVSETLASGVFDRMRNAFDACLMLLDRFYADADRRELVLKRVVFYANQMPPAIRIDLHEKIAQCAIKHGDQPVASKNINDVNYLVEHLGWRPESRIPLLARVSRLQAMAGDKDAARRTADAALVLFDVERERLENFDRAAALRPVAEAYQALGDSADALAIYKRAVADGAINPNARPRANDLTATCISMATNAVEPDAELWITLREIRQGLVDPW
jgi:tetratricopeptide (TPR) repeat protein